MRTTICVLLLALTAVAGGRLAAQSATGAAPALPPNKQLIIDFFAFSGSREARAERFLAPGYVQHNPRFLRMDEITGAKGNQAWVAAGAEAARRGIQLVALGGIPLRNPIIVLHDGDLAHAVYRGSRPDPANPAVRRDIFAFESFRIRDGQFTEHWDQVRLAAGWMMGAPPQPAARGGAAAAPVPAAPAPAATVPEPPATCVAAPAQLAANRRLVLTLAGELAGPATGRRSFAANFVDHSAPRAAVTGRTVDHVVADCDYVSVVWKETLPDPDAPARTWEAFTFDAFRIVNGQAVEHWSDVLP